MCYGVVILYFSLYCVSEWRGGFKQHWGVYNIGIIYLLSVVTVVLIHCSFKILQCSIYIVIVLVTIKTREKSIKNKISKSVIHATTLSINSTQLICLFQHTIHLLVAYNRASCRKSVYQSSQLSARGNRGKCTRRGMMKQLILQVRVTHANYLLKKYSFIRE